MQLIILWEHFIKIFITSSISCNALNAGNDANASPGDTPSYNFASVYTLQVSSALSLSISNFVSIPPHWMLLTAIKPALPWRHLKGCKLTWLYVRLGQYGEKLEEWMDSGVCINTRQKQQACGVFPLNGVFCDVLNQSVGHNMLDAK